MRPLLFVHLFTLGLWLGCVLVEGVLEGGAVYYPELRRAAPRLHQLIDLFVEIPCFTTVLVTGLLMMSGRPQETLFSVKLGLGLYTILVNVLCVLPVWRRQRAAAGGDTAEVALHSRRIGYAFAAGLPSGIAALAIGLHYLGLY